MLLNCETESDDHARPASMAGGGCCESAVAYDDGVEARVRVSDV